MRVCVRVIVKDGWRYTLANNTYLDLFGKKKHGTQKTKTKHKSAD